MIENNTENNTIEKLYPDNIYEPKLNLIIPESASNNLEKWDLDTFDSVRASTYNKIESGAIRLPAESLKQLRDLLDNDDITPEEFIRRTSEISVSGHNIFWKLNLILKDLLKLTLHFISIVNWGQVFTIIIGILSVALICKYIYINYYGDWSTKWKAFYYNYYKKYIGKPIIKKVTDRLISPLGYLFPFIEGCDVFHYMMTPQLGYLQFLFPPFIKTCLEWYQMTGGYAGTFYLFIIYGAFIRKKFPESRLIRYHFMYGLFISNFFHLVIPILLPNFRYYESLGDINKLISFSVVGMGVLLWYIGPGVFHALTGTYVGQPFLRDNIEIHLGRDDKWEDDFKWWDRR